MEERKCFIVLLKDVGIQPWEPVTLKGMSGLIQMRNHIVVSIAAIRHHDPITWNGMNKSIYDLSLVNFDLIGRQIKAPKFFQRIPVRAAKRLQLNRALSVSMMEVILFIIDHL